MREAESMKRLAFVGITTTTFALLTAVIFVPMLYNYIQYVQTSLDTEINFCSHRSQGTYITPN